MSTVLNDGTVSASASPTLTSRFSAQSSNNCTNNNSSNSNSDFTGTATGTTSTNTTLASTKSVAVTPLDSQGKQRIHKMTASNMLSRIPRIVQHQWKGNMDFVYAQAQVVLILAIAYIGNNWKYTYPRNENQNYTLFWGMNVFILVVGLTTMKHTPSHRSTIQILSRSQTEEWKGWMQWAFIMVRFFQIFCGGGCYIYIIDCVVVYRMMSYVSLSHTHTFILSL